MADKCRRKYVTPCFIPATEKLSHFTLESANTQFAVNWALIGVALFCAIPAVLAVTPSPVTEEIDSDSQDNSASDKKYSDIEI